MAIERCSSCCEGAGPRPPWTLPGAGAWREPGDLWPRSGLQGPMARSKQPGAGRSFPPGTSRPRTLAPARTLLLFSRPVSPVGAHGGRGRTYLTPQALRGTLAQGCPLRVSLPHCPPRGPLPRGLLSHHWAHKQAFPDRAPGSCWALLASAFQPHPWVPGDADRQAWEGAGARGRHGTGQPCSGMTQVRTWWCRHPRHVHRRPDGPGGGGIGTRAGVAQAASAWGLPWGQWLGSEGGRDQPWASVGEAGVRAASPLPAQGPQSPSCGWGHPGLQAVWLRTARGSARPDWAPRLQKPLLPAACRKALPERHFQMTPSGLARPLAPATLRPARPSRQLSHRTGVSSRVFLHPHPYDQGASGCAPGQGSASGGPASRPVPRK